MNKRCNKIAMITAMAALFINVFSGCNILPEEEEVLAPPLVQPKRTEYELYNVGRKDITKSLKGVGVLIAEEEQSLYFIEARGRLKSIDVELGQGVKAGSVLARLETGDLQNRIILQNNSIEKIQIQLDHLKNLYEKNLSMPLEFRPPQKELDDMKMNIKLQEIDLRSAQAIGENLQKDLKRADLIAPFDGVVTFVENLKTGDPVEAYKSVITIADPGKLQVYYHSSVGLSDIKLGMKAKVKYENKEFQGEVVLCSDNAPKDALEKYKNALVIKVDGLPVGAKWGSTIDFSIDIHSKKNVISIPNKGLRKMFSRTYVQVMEGDSKKEFDVEVGLESTYDVEILSGLKEGQMVILN